MAANDRAAFVAGAAGSKSNLIPNPVYGTDPFNPNSRIEQVPADPDMAQPLPQGRALDNRFKDNPLVAARMAQAQAARQDMPTYLKENADALVNEQSLIDRGKGVLAQLFDYRDTADAQLFGVNVSAVEAVWDGFLRHYTGAFDLLNIGIGGVLSAMPGGVETLSYDQLSGGKDVGEVLSGEMEAGSAPSPGQIALASIAKEVKRIRSGGARLTDVLLMNPATGPFILAGLAADENSPLQQEGFDIMDKVQREKAFGSGWEKWMSGITDAGLAFADPTIGLGVGLKVARAGMLGAHGPVRTAEAMRVALQGMDLEDGTRVAGALDELAPLAENMLPDGKGWASEAEALRSAVETGSMGTRPIDLSDPNKIDALIAVNEAVRSGDRQGVGLLSRITTATPKPDNLSPIADLLYEVSLVDDATGAKVRNAEWIAARAEFDGLPNGDALASLLYSSDSPYINNLILQSAHGVGAARTELLNLAPAMADAVARMSFEQITSMARMEGQMLADARGMLDRVIENAKTTIAAYDSQLDRLPEGDPQRLPLENRKAMLTATMTQANEIAEIVVQGKRPDWLDATSHVYNPEIAEKVVDDLTRQRDAVGIALREEIADAALGSPTAPFITKNNPFARMVAGSRTRRADAAYQFAVEGAPIYQRKRKYVEGVTEKVDAKTLYTPPGALVPEPSVVGRRAEGPAVVKATEAGGAEGGWFPSSQFDISRARRAARVWRWFGQEVPSGLLALKGVAAINNEREWRATLNTDLYRGDPLKVQVKSIAEDGTEQIEEVLVGGSARREELIRAFSEAKNDPNVDTFVRVEELEREIFKDYARAYGVDPREMDMLAREAQRARNVQMDLVKKRGYFVDPEDGTIHYVPYLTSQLANGTYLQNFQALEKALIAKQKDSPLGTPIRVIGDTAGNLYEGFNNIWRPMTLMRLSYTQRNVWDGLIRSMAYQASLTPLLWPAKAVGYGVRNKVVAKAVDKRAAAAAERIGSGEYTALRTAYAQTVAKRAELHGTYVYLSGTDEFPAGYYRWTRDPDNPDIKGQFLEPVKEADYRAALQQNADELEAARANLEASVGQYEQEIAGTAFAKWRQKELADLAKQIEQHEAFDLVYERALGEALSEGGLAMDATLVRQSIEHKKGLAPLLQAQADLMYDPVRGLTMYRAKAGRAKRIGSGQSIGTGGNYYNDAFAGPNEQIARANVSADNTIKQTLSMRYNMLSSLWFRQVLRANVAVPFMPARKDEWIAGMIDVIETNASNPLVRELIRNGWDIDRTINTWVLGTKQGDEWIRRQLSMHGEDPDVVTRLSAAFAERAERRGGDVPREVVQDAVRVRVNKDSEQARLAALGRIERDLGGEPTVALTEGNAIRALVSDVANKTLEQMQVSRGTNDFLDLLEARAAQKGDPKIALRTNIDEATVRGIVDSLPADVELGSILGSEVITMGTERISNLWAKFTSTMFKYLGTIPEDSMVRAPFYNQRFKDARNDLVALWMNNNGLGDQLKGRYASTKAGKREGKTIETAMLKIPASELAAIEFKAHQTALRITRDYLYTIERRTNLGKYGEVLFPFVSASQNAVVVAGKLLYKEPWLAPFVADLWKAPDRLGVVDEEGNLQLPMPFPWVRDFLKNNPDIPFLGGVVDSTDMITVPKNFFNTLLPETGFGLVPRPTPWVQVGASELMKASVMPIDAPAPIKAVLGDDAADKMYKSLRDWIFGQDQGLSSKTWSYDMLLPAYAQRIVTSRDEFSTAYGYQYVLHWNTQMARHYAGERDEPPTEDEINKRTTNTFWFNFLGNFGLPTPLTPYPILTRPDIKTDMALAFDQFQKYQQAFPQDATQKFSEHYGDWMLQLSMSKVTKNIGGANPTPEAVSDIQALDPLIRDVAPDLGDHLEVLGILTNNRKPLSAPTENTGFEDSSYQWQQATKIAGRTETWRKVQSPAEALLERQRVAGWSLYRSGMDRIDAQLAARGLPNYNVAGARDLKAARDQMILNMRNNPEYKGWWLDFSERSGDRTLAAVRLMEKATTDNGFRTLMAQSGNEDVVRIMAEYTYYRRILLNHLQQTGTTLENDSNALLRQSWDTLRQRWKSQNVRWADIADFYLTGDDNPADPGQFALGEGLGNGG